MSVHRSNLAELFDMSGHIRQSNLIENVDSPFEDMLSLRVWGWLSQQLRISRGVLMQLHTMIMLGKLPVNELGQPRRVEVYVGGHKAPTPYTAHIQLGEWLETMRRCRMLDPKQMHVRFERIHPFTDGNGRTGRMLMWWHEMMLGLEPTLIRFDQRQDYYKWFEVKG